MKPNESRELDAWIAEHVMGQKSVWHTFITGAPPRLMLFNPVTKGWLMECQNYTTNGAAFAVLEKCAARLGDFEHISINCCEGEFAIKLAHALGFPNWDWITAPTLPLAICLFAKQLYSQAENSEENKL